MGVFTRVNRKCSSVIGKNETCDLYPSDHTWEEPERSTTTETVTEEVAVVDNSGKQVTRNDGTAVTRTKSKEVTRDTTDAEHEANRNKAQESRGAPHNQRIYLDAKGHSVVGNCKGYTDDESRKDDE